MGLISVPPESAPPAPVTPTDQVESDGFYPAILLADVQRQARVDTTVSPDRLRSAIVAAMIAVEQDLDAWRGLQEATGHASLADVPAREYGGESKLVALYRRAVAFTAAADLKDQLRELGTTAAGHDRADELVEASDDLRRDARFAIRDLLGRPRTTVELI